MKLALTLLVGVLSVGATSARVQAGLIVEWQFSPDATAGLPL